MGSDERKGGNKLNPNASEFYPTAYPSYPYYCASQLPRNLPVTDPPFPRFTPTTQALHATGCKLVAFNVDTTLPNRFLHEKFQRFGAVEKVEKSPNDDRIRFITFFDAEDANRARTGLDGRRVGLHRLKVEVSHWSPGPNPTVPYTVPPRLQQ